MAAIVKIDRFFNPYFAMEEAYLKEKQLFKLFFLIYC
jgi:hypothetical protein